MTLSTRHKCVEVLRNWMIKDKLMINDDKTEFLLIGTRQQPAKINTACSITVVNMTLIQVFVQEILACGLIVI